MVLASSKVVHGWLRIITERWFQSVELRVAVGHDDVDEIKLLLSSSVTSSVNGIIIFHFNAPGKSISRRLWLSSKNILSFAGLYHTTVNLLFFSLFTDEELSLHHGIPLLFSFGTFCVLLVLFQEATHTITFSISSSFFRCGYQLQFCNSVGVFHPKLSDAQLSIKFFSGWESTYFIT